MKKSLLAVALACLSFTATAQAADGAYLTHLEVFYGDLNLANRSGASTALRRIKFAASQVCGGAPDSMLDLPARSSYRGCVRVATDEAVARLKAPLVTSLYMSEPEDIRIAQAE